ncbi:MAG: hypothetical protein FWF27_00985 [Candidatus Bathyarchaeota archaeon]|nr:hypothetical protein [Candidatus Termiticorpusculum sp.]
MDFEIKLDDMVIKPYFDIVGIVGRKSSGKSFVAKVVYTLTPNVIVYDTNHEYDFDDAQYFDDLELLAKFCHKKHNFWDGEKPKTKKIIYQPNEPNTDDLWEFCDGIMQGLNDEFLVIVEELGRFNLQRVVDNSYKDMIDRGRHIGIGTLSTSRRIIDIPPYQRNSLDLLISFPTNSTIDIKLLNAYYYTNIHDKLSTLYASNPEKYQRYFAYTNKDNKVKIHPKLKF